MNALLNYLLEASLALTAFYGVYYCLLRKETNFHFVRTYLLAALLVSALVPFIDLSVQGNTSSIPVLSDAISTYWLPEIQVGNTLVENEDGSLSNFVAAWCLDLQINRCLSLGFSIRKTLLWLTIRCSSRSVKLPIFIQSPFHAFYENSCVANLLIKSIGTATVHTFLTSRLLLTKSLHSQSLLAGVYETSLPHHKG